MAKLLKSVLKWGLVTTAYGTSTSTTTKHPGSSSQGLSIVLDGTLNRDPTHGNPFGTKEIVPSEQSLEPWSPPHSAKDLVKPALKCLAVGVSLYVGYRTIKWWWARRRELQRKERADYILNLGRDVLNFMAEEASNEVTDFFYEEPVLPEGMIGEEEKGRRARRRHKSAPFLAKITHLTKNHFGGVPEPTKANQMAVTRMVYELCKEHNCLPHQTRHIISVVTPLVLTPDQFDISSRALLNGDDLCENRAAHSSLSTIDGWVKNLIKNPLDSKAWKRAMDVLVGLPDWQAFRLVH